METVTDPGGRPLRADAERTVRAILVAAERTLRREPGASMEQIAEAAGVARTTVHRRFSTREALLEALAVWGTSQFAAAVRDAHPETAPPLVALYQATVNVLRVKLDWGFAMSLVECTTDPEVSRVHAEIYEQCLDLFRRAQRDGQLHPDADPLWARRVYHALIHEVTQGDPVPDRDADALATLILDTLMRGLGSGGAGLAGALSGRAGPPRP